MLAVLISAAALATGGPAEDWSLSCPDRPGEVEIFVSSEYRLVSAGVINLVTKTTWATHTGFVACDGRVIDASPLLGVSVHKPLPLLVGVRRHYRFKADAAAVETFLRAQIGKPYNFGGFLTYAFGGLGSMPASWFCSELVQAAALAGGADLAHRRPKQTSPARIVHSSVLAEVVQEPKINLVQSSAPAAPAPPS